MRRQPVAIHQFKDSAVVVGALKCRFPATIQKHEQVLWWDAMTGEREAILPNIKGIFAKSNLSPARLDELGKKASSVGVELVEFQEEKEILPDLFEILGLDFQGARNPVSVSTPVHVVATSVAVEGQPKTSVGTTAHPQVITVPVDKTRPKKDQPRKHFNKLKLLALGRSLLHQQYVPIIVVPVYGNPDCLYRIEDGERRWRACQLVGKTTLEAIIATDVSEAESFKRSAICNFGREGHQPMEIAEALHRIRREDPSLTIKGLAEMLANSEGWVNLHLSLLKLTGPVQGLLNPELPEEERLNSTTAREISKLPPSSQLTAAEHVLKCHMGLDQVRHYIRHLMVEVGANTTSGRKRKPDDDYRILMTLLRKSEEGLDRLLDLPGGLTLEGLFRHRSSSREADNALETIDRIVEKLEKARIQIEASLSPVAGGRKGKVLPLANNK